MVKAILVPVQPECRAAGSCRCVNAGGKILGRDARALGVIERMGGAAWKFLYVISVR